MAEYRNAEGFVLVATLWALAALALLAGYIVSVVATQIQGARQEKRVFQADLDRRSTEATVIYLLVTGRMSHNALILEGADRSLGRRPTRDELRIAGIGDLRVTGGTYAGLGRARFSLQDEAGLLSVNSPRFPTFRTFLRHSGVTEEDIRQVIARIEDYIDSNDSAALGGAERDEYRRHQRAPPLNWIMASPIELTEVLGIRELIGPARWRVLRPLLTVRPVSGYNFNTMHPQVLAAMLGLDAQGLRGVLEERQRVPLSRLTQLAMLTGKHLEIDEMDMAVLPSNFLRLAVWHETVGPRIVVGIELTPLGEVAPWRKDYRYSEPAATRNGSRIPSEPILEAATPLLR